MFDFQISMFGFVALWSPVLIFSLLSIMVVYLYKERFTKNISKKIFFVTGIVLLYIFLGSPVDLLGHLIFSFHMIQMAGIYFIAIPCILYGLLNSKLVHWLSKYLQNINPIISIGLFNIIFSMYHLPIIFDYVMTHNIAHKIIHSLLILTCFILWYPLITSSWNAIKKIGYIFLNGVLLTPACALIIFADELLYRIYIDPVQWSQMMTLCVPTEIFQTLSLDGPYFFQWIPPLDDQHLGGVLMKIIQEIVLGIFLGYIFFTGFEKDRKIDRIEDKRISSS